MTRYDRDDASLPALGEPVEANHPGATEDATTAPGATGSNATRPEAGAEGGGDFADEHDDVTVAADVSSGTDTEREPESPHGWAGLEEGPLG